MMYLRSGTCQWSGSLHAGIWRQLSSMFRQHDVKPSYPVHQGSYTMDSGVSKTYA